MKSEVDVTRDTIELLSAADLDEAMAAAAQIVIRLAEPQAVSVLIWDADLESFSDARSFGPRANEFEEFAGAFAGSYQHSCQRMQGVDPGEVGIDLSAGLSPVQLYRVFDENNLIACLLTAGPIDSRLGEIEGHLRLCPLARVLSHAWEFRELKRENIRLREQFEQIEDSGLEQTRKLIHAVTARDALYTRQVERERLIYSISNAVRSSLNIQEVLQTAVNHIGDSLQVSRCLLLRPLNIDGQLAAYEYHHPSQEPVQQLFFSEEGIAFLNTAMRRASPQDLGDPTVDTQSVYSRQFLQQLGLRSGLIVPLVLRDTSLGVIFLQDCEVTRDWSIDDSAHIGALADLLCVGIENAELHEERQRQAVTDGLTGVSNRRHFSETFYREFERARRYGQPLSLIVADLDFLKNINDTYGHQVGDEAIKSIARILHEGSRSIDLAARYGGEEFCLLLPNTELAMAEQTAERLRKEIAGCLVEGPGTISVSIGVASFPDHADNPDTLFQKADEALYEAKQQGRNCVRVAATTVRGAAERATT